MDLNILCYTRGSIHSQSTCDIITFRTEKIQSIGYMKLSE
jgi:hypothetical protein